MNQQLPLSFENTAIAFEHMSDKELKRANFLFSNIGKPWLVKFGAFATPLAFKLHLPVKGIIKATIFNHFCGGESLEEAVKAAEALGRYGVGVALDYGVEALEGEDNYDKAVPEFLRAIQFAAGKPYIRSCPSRLPASHASACWKRSMPALRSQLKKRPNSTASANAYAPSAPPPPKRRSPFW